MKQFLKAREGMIGQIGSLCLDVAIACIAFLTAYVIAFGFDQISDVPGLVDKLFAFGTVCTICFAFFEVNRTSWRYVSIPDLLAIIKGSLFAVGIYTVGAFLVSRGDNVPRSVPIVSALFLIGGLSSIRLAYRLAVDGSLKSSILPRRIRRGGRGVLLLGITPNAESFIRSWQRTGKQNVAVVGIIDDSTSNRSRMVHGVRVMGGLADLPSILKRFQRDGVSISELIVAEHQPSRQRLEDVLEAASVAGLKVTRIPDPTTTASITSALDPKPIEIGDLLGRPEVRANIEEVAQLIQGRVVLATGAGGSIGSELCRQIASFNPAKMIITDSSEYHLYMLDKEMRGRHPDLPIVTRILDVRDARRVNRVFLDFQPEVIFHAAALKHVNLVEENVLEGIKTNVLGTRNVANAALEHKASIFVMISTDKAVNPRNIMGATKRAAEAYCQALDVESEVTRFKTVRFGNVLGSNGSVVPRFKEQIAAGGPITVTHPNIMRYFMTIPEAVRLVLHASAHGLRHRTERGRIMVLDMGKPIRIVDLAERMIQLAGYRRGVDIDIVFTGLRPGEKLYEELFSPAEIQDGRTEEGYVIASPKVIDRALLARTFSGLAAAVDQEDETRAIELLSHIVPEYQRASVDDEDHETVAPTVRT